MPRICSFYGIVIYMYHEEAPHPGRAHFHAEYGEDEASFDIETLEQIAGRCRRSTHYHDLDARNAATARGEADRGLRRPRSLRGRHRGRGRPCLLLDCGGVFEPLRNLEFFRTLRVYTWGQTIYWPRHPGAPEGEQFEDVSSVQADIAPETLYAHACRNATTAA